MDFYFKSLQIKSIYIPYAQNDYVYYIETVDKGAYKCNWLDKSYFKPAAAPVYVFVRWGWGRGDFFITEAYLTTFGSSVNFCSEA